VRKVFLDVQLGLNGILTKRFPFAGKGAKKKPGAAS
jgi:hypothetical protein